MRILFVAVALCVACGGDDTVQPVDASMPDTSIADTSVPDTTDVLVADAAPDKVVWAHSATKLYRFDPDSHALGLVGTFSCAVDQVFNIAVNEKEQIYGVTSQGLVAIDGKSAACYPIASGVYPHSLAFVPKGVLDPDREALVGYRYAQYIRIDETTGAQTPIGAFAPNGLNQQFTVSGDLFALPGGHLFVTVTAGPAGDQLIEADPKTGKAIKVVGDTHVLALLGLGQWAGMGYAFSAEGRAYALGLSDGGAVQVYPSLDASADAETISFTGAGVTTRAPIN